MQISHRGNTNGRNFGLENNPEHIEKLLSQGISCEIDVWFYKKKFYLGHDTPTYEVPFSFLYSTYYKKEELICHAKNLLALDKMLDDERIHCFFQDKDDYSITSHHMIWTNIKREICLNSIIVDLRPNPDYNRKCYGVCVNFIK